MIIEKVVVLVAAVLMCSCSTQTNRNQLFVAAYKLGVLDGGIAEKLDNPKTGDELLSDAIKRRKGWTPNLPFVQNL